MSITLKAARVNAGLSLNEAAAALVVSSRTLANWEKAKTFPDVTMITRIENLYGVTYNDLNFLPSNSVLTEKGGE
ncbi:MAG: helix-turn-helix domain-containing protein [Bacteroidales bacterium]|nr:helix-turn-helix domain-containing protein [Bacteroidales bacterium]